MIAGEFHETLQEAVHALGYQNITDFVRIQTASQLAQKAAYYQSRVELYEQKYGMRYDEFMQRVVDREDIQLKRFGIIEKEDDSFDWDDSLHSFNYYKQRLNAVEHAGTH